MRGHRVSPPATCAYHHHIDVILNSHVTSRDRREEEEEEEEEHKREECAYSPTRINSKFKIQNLNFRIYPFYLTTLPSSGVHIHPYQISYDMINHVRLVMI